MRIKVYGADWCIDCVNVKNFFSSKGFEFEYVIVTKNDKAIAFLEQVNKGKRIIPTIVVDGKVYANPGINRLMNIIEE